MAKVHNFLSRMHLEYNDPILHKQQIPSLLLKNVQVHREDWYSVKTNGAFVLFIVETFCYLCVSFSRQFREREREREGEIERSVLLSYTNK